MAVLDHLSILGGYWEEVNCAKEESVIYRLSSQGFASFRITVLLRVQRETQLVIEGKDERRDVTIDWHSERFLGSMNFEVRPELEPVRGKNCHVLMSTFIERICRVCSDALGDHANSVAKFAAGAPSYPRSAYISLMRTNAAVVMVLTALRSSVSLRYSSPTRLRLVSRMWRRATMSSPVVTAATLPAKLQIARETGSTSVDCGALEYLASKVVQGTADKVKLNKTAVGAFAVVDWTLKLLSVCVPSLNFVLQAPPEA